VNALAESIRSKEKSLVVVDGQNGAIVSDALEVAGRNRGKHVTNLLYETKFGHQLYSSLKI
jgi:hypothetical protein